jgi:hypothetical protein
MPGLLEQNRAAEWQSWRFARWPRQLLYIIAGHWSLRLWESEFPQMGKRDGGFYGPSWLNGAIRWFLPIVAHGTEIDNKNHSTRSALVAIVARRFG